MSTFVNWACQTIGFVLMFLFRVVTVFGAVIAIGGVLFVLASVGILFCATRWAGRRFTFIRAVDFLVSKLEAVLALVDEDSGAHFAELLANV